MPAYCPVLEGVQEVANSGVVVEVKKVISMTDIGIVVGLPESFGGLDPF